MRSRLEHVERLLDGEIDLSNEEIWYPKRHKRPWPESEEEASELWRLRSRSRCSGRPAGP